MSSRTDARRRRALALRGLGIGAILLGVQARVFAATEGSKEEVMLSAIELEASPYGGTASGRFNPQEGGSDCAGFMPPGARVKYGGMGAEVRARLVAQRRSTAARSPAPQPVHQESRVERSRGVTLSLAGALQYERYELLEPGSVTVSNPTPAEPNATRLLTNPPSPMLRGAFRPSFGFDFRPFGLTAGVLAYQQLGEVGARPCEAAKPDGAACVDYPSLDFSLLPNIALRLGPLEPFHVDVGIGAYDAALLLDPGIYAGVGLGWAGVELAGHLGIHDSFHNDDAHARYEVSANVPLSSTLRLGAAGAMERGLEAHREYQGRLHLELVLPIARR